MAESKEELKGLLMKVKRESEETGLTFKTLRSWHPVHHFMANRRGQSGEAVTDFIFWGSKITVDGCCSHEIKRRLLLGRKVMINLDSVLKSRDISLPARVHLVKTMVFLVVMYGCETWTKEAE